MAKVPSAKPTRAAHTVGIDVGQITNFSGGINFRDAPSELAATEVYDAYNATFDERGGVQSRLGFMKRNGTPLVAGGAAKVINDYYSPMLGAFVTQVGASLYFNNVNAAVKTFTTADCVTFTDFAGSAIACHPVDGLWQSTNGTTWTKITSTNAPTTGTNCVAVWMAKLFVGMSDGTVHWSPASSFSAAWGATDFNAIWTKDEKPIVALHVASGQDIQGRPGLLVFKQGSCYRMNDPGTGAYTVLDTTHGCAGPKAVVGIGARVVWIGRGGIWWFREDQAQPINASDLLRPLWNANQLSFANQLNWAAGRYQDRAFLSCSSIGSSTNDVCLEYHPDEGWVTLRSDSMSCYSMDASDALYGGSPSVNGQAYQLNSAATDDGANISGWFQTRWVVPNGGFQAQVLTARAHGRGGSACEMIVRTDYSETDQNTYPFNVATSGSLYDSGLTYDSGLRYGSQLLAETESFDGIGTCRQLSLRFTFTVNSTVVGRSLGTTGVAATLGAFGLYGIELLYVPLGLT